MATSLTRPLDVNDVVSVAELGALVFGFLDNIDDLRSASLTNKRFNSASQRYLWRAIRLSYVPTHGNLGSPRAFWCLFAGPLARFTLSLSIDLQVAAPDLFKEIADMPRWESWHTKDNLTETTIKRGVNDFFRGLEAALKQARYLRSFTARDVPRIFDLVLLFQQHHPEIESLDITAPERDKFSLNLDLSYDLSRLSPFIQLDIRSEVSVPLANCVNFGDGTINPASALSFPNLRSLSLNNIQYDGRHPSPFVKPLVAILKGSPGLTYLELSLRHQLGTFSADGHFQLLMDARTDPPPNYVRFMKALCVHYAAAGGQPLRLKILRLGSLCAPVDPFRHGSTTNYLAYLFDTSRLQELHVEGLTCKDDMVSTVGLRQLGFTLVSSTTYPLARCLINVRKITMPWVQGDLLRWLNQGFKQHLEHLILRIDGPAPDDWTHVDPYRGVRPPLGPSWIRGWFLRGTECRTMRLKGLVLPTKDMTPDDANKLLGFCISWIKPMHSIKIRLPSLTGWSKGPDGQRYRNNFYRRMARMTELRELSNQEGQKAQNGASRTPYPTEAEFRRFSTAIAGRCPKLEYLRILDRAWRVTRAPRRAYALQPLTAREVEEYLPEAFDFGRPKVF